MSTATTDKLSALHAQLASLMENALKSEEKRVAFTAALYDTDLADMDEAAAKALSAALALSPSARVDNALMSTVARFLKDNEITSGLAEGPDEDEQIAKLRELQGKRRVAQTPLDTMQ